MGLKEEEEEDISPRIILAAYVLASAACSQVESKKAKRAENPGRYDMLAPVNSEPPANTGSGWDNLEEACSHLPAVPDLSLPEYDVSIPYGMPQISIEKK